MKTKNIFILAVAILFNISAFAQINVVDDNYKLSSGYNETTEMEKIDIYKYLKTQDVWMNIEQPYSNVVGEKIYVYDLPQHKIDDPYQYVYYQKQEQQRHYKYPCLNRKEGTLKAKSMLPGYYTVVSIILTKEDINRHKEECFAMKIEPSDTLYLKKYFDILGSNFSACKNIMENIYIYDMKVKEHKKYTPRFDGYHGWGLILENENGEQLCI